MCFIVKYNLEYDFPTCILPCFHQLGQFHSLEQLLHKLFDHILHQLHQPQLFLLCQGEQAVVSQHVEH